MIADQGLVGFVTVNGHGGAQGVAPWGGLERRLSVNPDVLRGTGVRGSVND